jgi:hypothetical protein
MSSFPIPIRIQTGLSVILSIAVDLLVGTVFALILSTTPNNPVRLLLQNQYVGYRTKLMVFAVLAFVLGFSFTLLGDIIIRYFVRGLFFPKSTRQKMIKIHSPYQANIEIITQAFDWHTSSANIKLPPPGQTKQETPIDRNYAMVGTLLKHYTSLYKDIANEYWLLRARRDFASGTFVALTFAAIWVSPWRRVLLLCSMTFAIFTWYLSFLGTRSYGYLISVGYFRERNISNSQPFEK